MFKRTHNCGDLRSSEIDNKVIQLSKYLDSNEIKYVLDFLNNNVEGFKKEY